MLDQALTEEEQLELQAELNEELGQPDEDRPFDPTQVEKAQKAARGKYTETEAERRAEYKKQASTKEYFRTLKDKETIRLKDNFKKAFASGIDIIERISPAIGREVNKWVKAIGEQNAKDQKATVEFMKAFNRLEKKDRIKFSHHLFNRRKQHINKILKIYNKLL